MRDNIWEVQILQNGVHATYRFQPKPDVEFVNSHYTKVSGITEMGDQLELRIGTQQVWSMMGPIKEREL